MSKRLWEVEITAAIHSGGVMVKLCFPMPAMPTCGNLNVPLLTHREFAIPVSKNDGNRPFLAVSGARNTKNQDLQAGFMESDLSLRISN